MTETSVAHTNACASKDGQSIKMKGKEPSTSIQIGGDKSVITMKKLRNMTRKKNYKSHAFQKMSPTQIIGLIQITIMITSFYSIIHRLFPHHDIIRIFKDISTPSVTFNIVHLLTELVYPLIIIIAFNCYLILSLTDSGIKMSDKLQDKDSGVVNTDKFWCYLCEAIREEGCKHCFVCGKCVPQFDHHCPFLNACIGGKNYTVFIIFCSLLEILCCVHILIAWYAWWNLLNPYKWNRYCEDYTVLSGLILGSTLIPVIFCFSLMSLLHFHAYLACKGYTTFDWIIKKRQKQARKRLNKLKQENNRKIQRIAHNKHNQNYEKKHSITLHEIRTSESINTTTAVNRLSNQYSAAVDQIALNVQQ